MTTETYQPVDLKCPTGDKGKIVLDTKVGKLTCLECGGYWRGREFGINMDGHADIHSAIAATKKKAK